MQFKVLHLISLNKREVIELLQKLITNDIIKHDYIYALLMTHKARFISEMFIYQSKEDIFIEVPNSFVGVFKEKLNLYKIGIELEILETNYQVIYSKKAALNDSKIDNLNEKCIKKIIYQNQDPRNPNLGYRTIVEFDASDLDIKNNQMSILKKSNDEYLQDKYKYEIIDYIDLYPDSLIPKFNISYAFNYNKGCYIGQETIAAAKKNGQNYIVTSFEIDNTKDNLMNIENLCKHANLLKIYAKNYLNVLKLQEIFNENIKNITLNVWQVDFKIYDDQISNDTPIGQITSIYFKENRIFCLGIMRNQNSLIQIDSKVF